MDYLIILEAFSFSFIYPLWVIELQKVNEKISYSIFEHILFWFIFIFIVAVMEFKL